MRPGLKGSQWRAHENTIGVLIRSAAANSVRRPPKTATETEQQDIAQVFTWDTCSPKKQGQLLCPKAHNNWPSKKITEP
jgi:hypothetical protein